MRKARLGCRESCAAVDQHGNGAILPTILAKVIWHLVVEDTGFNMRIANIKWSLNHFSNKCQKCPNHQLWPSSPPPRLHQVLSFPGLKQRAFLGYAVSRHPKNQPELTVAFEILMVMLANRFKRLRDVALWPKRSKYAMSQCICWRVDRNIFQWKHLRWSQLSTTLKNIDPKQRITVYKLYIIEMLIWKVSGVCLRTSWKQMILLLWSSHCLHIVNLSTKALILEAECPCKNFNSPLKDRGFWNECLAYLSDSAFGWYMVWDCQR